MKTRLFTTALLFCICFHSFSQTTDTSYRYENRHGSGMAIVGLVMAEGFIVGMGVLAGKTHFYGDKIIGGLYAGASAATLVYGPVYWITLKNKDDAANRRSGIANLVTLWGMSYGFYRIANYNLRQAGDVSAEKRFGRNMLEMHAAYIVPIVAGVLVEKHLVKKKGGSSQNTSFFIAPNSAGLVVKF